MKIRLCVLAIFSVTVLGCSQVEDSSGKVLENAGSVLRSADDKMLYHPEGGSERRIERSAGKVLENAGSVVRSDNGTQEEEIDRPDRGNMY